MFRHAAVGILSALSFQAQAFNVQNILINLAHVPREASLQTDYVLEEISRQENRQLPRLINSELRFDRVSAEAGGRYVRHYSVLNGRTPAENRLHFERAIMPSLVQQTCTDKAQQIFLRNNVTVVHYYALPQGENLAKLEVNAPDCE